MKKIIDVIIPHGAGLLIIIVGWYISLVDVGLGSKLQTTVLFTKGTGFGLLMIIFGAYLPWIWTGIRGKMNRN